MYKYGIDGGMMCRVLGRVLAHADWVGQLKILDRAKMPVIKFVAMGTLPVDLTIALPSHAGLATAALVRQMIFRFHIAPLVFPLKKLLFSNSLADPFTGGLGSYALVLMVATSLDASARKSSNNRKSDGESFNSEGRDDLDKNRILGQLFIEFLQLFGRSFDTTQDAVICVRTHGSENFTMQIGKRQQSASSLEFSGPTALIVDDPVQQGNNVGSTCFRFNEVQRVFSDALTKLLSSSGDDDVKILLNCLE